MPKCLDVTMNVTAESKSQPPSGCDEPPGKVDQFLNDGLDPGVILFTKTMAPVQGNDLFVLDAQACPPPLKFDLGKKQLLSLLVNGALRDSHDPAEGKLFLFAVFTGGAMPLQDTEDRHPFSRTGSFHRPFGKGLSLPWIGVLLAGDSLDDVIHIVMPGEFNPVSDGVVGRVGAKEELILTDVR
jgi:hypothetical protein